MGGSKEGAPRQGCAPPRGPNSFTCMQFSAKEYISTPTLRVGAPQENPRFATASHYISVTLILQREFDEFIDSAS